MATDTTATGGQGDADLVDWQVALDVCAGDHGLLAGVVEAFLQETPKQMAAIYQAIDSADANVLSRAAHTLKSSFGYFGARSAFDLALHLELSSKNEPLSELLSSTRELDSLLSRIQAILSEYLQRESSP